MAIDSKNEFSSGTHGITINVLPSGVLIDSTDIDMDCSFFVSVTSVGPATKDILIYSVDKN